MTREITTPIVLAHTNIVPGSEIISVKGSPIPKLIKNSDYIIDYEKGLVRFLSDGAAISIGDLIEEKGLDVQYSYKLNLDDPNLFESQREVFDEVAIREDQFVVSVKNSPVNDVLRLFNLTTREEYIPTSINNNKISFTGSNPPRIKTLERLFTSLSSSVYFPQRDMFKDIYKIQYPSQFSPNLNPIDSLNSIQSKSKYPIVLVVGGQDILETQIERSVSLEVAGIQLITGGRTLRNSTIVLSPDVDYSFELEPKMGVLDYNSLTINITPQGVQKIRTNNIYLKLFYSEIFSLINTGPTFSLSSHPTNEVIDFSQNNNQPLLNYFTQATIGEIVDKLIPPKIKVFNPDTNFTYVEGIDYAINLTQRTITKLLNGRIGQVVLVSFQEEKNIEANATIVSDVVLVDYVWGTNSLNWSSLINIVPTTQVENLNIGQRFVVAKTRPTNPEEVLIYQKSDPFKTPRSKVNSFNEEALRLEIEPIPSTDEYVLEYKAISQPIPEGTPYFITYKYGATRRVLGDRFARLMSLDEGETFREEKQSLAAGQTSTVLARSPIDLDSIIIFAENDPQESPVATPKEYDNTTGILSFTSLSSSGRYIIRYKTTGYDSKSLRDALKALFENFEVGPTKTGFENIIGAFVDTPPEITSGLDTRFTIANRQKTIGNRIKNLSFEQSPPLSDGRSSISFLPSKFNLGALFETSKGSYVQAPAINNFSMLEGTLEFLTGVIFDVNDNQRHYFFDLVGDHPTKNRMSLYKNKNGFLNFDIWDNNENLFRTTTDLTKSFFTEVIELQAGDNTAVLANDATPATSDLNENQTPDLFEGLETKFIIMPETGTYPPTFKRASIKVLGYDPPSKVVTFEEVSFSGRYIFSYLSGLAKFEEAENFIAATWKLHTFDGEPPFYRLYMNGIRVVDLRLTDIQRVLQEVADAEKQSLYDQALYDVDAYKGSN